jgi:tetratricopeptide (TPR) repeat protein
MGRRQDAEGEARTPLPDPNALSGVARADLVRRALAQAEELRSAGRHDEGIALLLDALRVGELKAQVLFRLGNLYFDRGDLMRAEHAYRRATEEDPQHAAAHHNLGVVYRRQGKISQSVKLLKKARWMDLRNPRGAEPSSTRAGGIRRWLRPTVVVPLAILVVLIVWLVVRFT